MFGLFAEIERYLISERTKEGIQRAREEGKQIGRPKGIGTSKLDQYKQDIIEWRAKGLSVSPTAKLTCAGWTTVKHFIDTREL